MHYVGLVVQHQIIKQSAISTAKITLKLNTLCEYAKQSQVKSKVSPKVSNVLGMSFVCKSEAVQSGMRQVFWERIPGSWTSVGKGTFSVCWQFIVRNIYK